MRLLILAFAAGVAWLQFQPELPRGWMWMLAMGGCLLLLGWRWQHRRAVVWLIVCAGVLLGAGYAAGRAEWRLADHLPTAWEGRDLEVVGVVAELPQVFEPGSRFRFAVEQVLTPAAVVPQNLMLSWYAARRDLRETTRPTVRPGERWRLTVRLKRPHGNVNPHAFDYEAWLLERGIRATGYVRPDERAERLAAMVWTPGHAVERLRDRVRERFRLALPEGEYPYAGILVALSVGDQRAIDGDLWNLFNRTGTTHLMSISGLHVTMLAALAALLTSWVWRRIPSLALRLPSRRAAIVAGVLTALFYTFIAGFAVPTQRTLYMLAVATLALYSGRPLAASRILCLALLAVLLIDPWAVLAPGFWLSFGAVGALLYMGAARVGHVGGWRAYLQEWGLVQWTATLASLPVLLFVFQQFSLVSPFANALAIPVISLIVAPLALLATLLPWEPLFQLAHAVLAMLMALLEIAATWPVWQAAVPPLWAAFCAAMGVMLCLLPGRTPGRWSGLFLLLPTLFWPAPRPPASTAWIDVLDVGQGQAIVVRTAGHTLLYDTGPSYSAESNAGQRVIVPYLRALGVNRLDLLMLSHRDNDHAGGLDSVMAALPVKRLVSPFYPGEGRCRDGQTWVWEGVRFRVLHPAEGADLADGRNNHFSCVLRIEAGRQRLLLTSDIEAADERAMLARNREELRADILLVPHHGSRTSSSPAFLEAVRPAEAIVSVGYRNRFGHPKAEVMDRYAALPARIWRTDRHGAVRVRLSWDIPEIHARRQQAWRYWYSREP